MVRILGFEFQTEITRIVIKDQVESIHRLKSKFRRFILAFMGVLAVINVYISRNNITIAVVPMVNQTYLKLERASRIDQNSNSTVSVKSELQCSHASGNNSHLGWFKLQQILQLTNWPRMSEYKSRHLI